MQATENKNKIIYISMITMRAEFNKHIINNVINSFNIFPIDGRRLKAQKYIYIYILCL